MLGPRRCATAGRQMCSWLHCTAAGMAGRSPPARIMPWLRAPTRAMCRLASLCQMVPGYCSPPATYSLLLSPKFAMQQVVAWLVAAGPFGQHGRVHLWFAPVANLRSAQWSHRLCPGCPIGYYLLIHNGTSGRGQAASFGFTRHHSSAYNHYVRPCPPFHAL